MLPYVAFHAKRQFKASMTILDPNLSACNAMWADLVERQKSRWVIFHDGQLVGLYSGREDAAEMALIRFGNEHCLIRQIDGSLTSAGPTTDSSPAENAA